MLFSFGTFDSFPGCSWQKSSVWCMTHVPLPKWSLNQFKPVQLSRRQVLIACCSNTYTVSQIEKVRRAEMKSPMCLSSMHSIYYDSKLIAAVVCFAELV